MVKKPTASKKPVKPGKKPKMGLYSNLAYRSRLKADTRARKHAEDLAKMPKNPILRIFARLHPKRVFHYWFSREGLFRFLKIIAATILIIIIFVGGLFLYFKKDLEAIRPEELYNRVSNTVNTYLDRNGEVLWEDRGDGDYRLVVDGADISTYMRQATVALEDRNFYNHPGVDLQGLVRAAFVTLSGGDVQGGSTLTQQLIKQVYFFDEAANRDVSGIPRKIKEVILALEVEKMYDKEQIITMYLNESPYGGRRNGVESGAQTYFGKSAKNLTLAESALLAGIPNNPWWYNPYNEDPEANEDLVARQHYTLDVMVELGYITREQADEAKAVQILDTILPEQNQYRDLKAPHFVLETKRLLEEKFGIRTLRSGGFTIKTTLDLRAQGYAEAAMAEGAKSLASTQTDNAAMASVDVETGQVIAMMGSVNWDIPGFGQVNAATALLDPGSSIKPLLDFLPLFMQRSGQNWGPGSILRDENINAIYCAGYIGKCSVSNANGATYGDITIRRSLASSLNRPAIKALYINGIDNSLDILHKLGNWSYCAYGENAGLSMAIGGGCSVRAVEHANAYASVARGGVYKPLAYWLEVKNSSGDIVDRWEDTAGDRVVDEQVAYMISSILSDAAARTALFAHATAYGYGFVIPDLWTGTKSGTTDNGAGKAKETWLASYSPVVATTVWNGNHDGRPMNGGYAVIRRVVNNYMSDVHKNIYGPEGKWVKNQAPVRPSGIQEFTVNGIKDIWPSWYNEKTSGLEKKVIEFDTISRRMATSATPPETRVKITITKSIDPMTKTEVWIASGGGSDEENAAYLEAFKNELYDNAHSAGDARPSVSVSNGAFANSIAISVVRGNGRPISRYEIRVDGTIVDSGNGNPPSTYTLPGSWDRVTVWIRDELGYVATDDL